MERSFVDKSITVECDVEITNPMMESFNADWTITLDPKDMILCTDFSSLGKKLAPELALMGVKKIKCQTRKSEYYNKWVFIGVKTKEETDVIPNDI